MNNLCLLFVRPELGPRTSYYKRSIQFYDGFHTSQATYKLLIKISPPKMSPKAIAVASKCRRCPPPPMVVFSTDHVRHRGRQARGQRKAQRVLLQEGRKGVMLVVASFHSTYERTRNVCRARSALARCLRTQRSKPWF